MTPLPEDDFDRPAFGLGAARLLVLVTEESGNPLTDLRKEKIPLPCGLKLLTEGEEMAPLPPGDLVLLALGLGAARLAGFASMESVN